ncbi:MAG TPA: O-antigen ligase family protein [Patescibacteria group bacterium]|nr:O-antigen ligase family protein [Patescibacteria group bacterium]
MTQDTTKQSFYPSRWVAGLLALWFFVLPFERLPTLEYAGFTVKISYIVGLAVLLFWLWGRSKLSFRPSDWWLAAFWSAALLGLLSSPSPPRSIIVFLMWSFVFLLYFAVSRLMVKYGAYLKIEKVILITAAIVCLFGLFQFIGDSFGLPSTITGLRDFYTHTVLGYPRIQSVALEPLYFSNFLLAPLFLALKQSSEMNKLWNKYQWLAILILVNIILGFARGAYLALIISLIILAIYLLYQRKIRPLVSVFGAIIISLVISYGFIVLSTRQLNLRDIARHTIAQDTQSSDSVGGRLGTYRLAWQQFRTKPILGHGPGSFGPLATPNNQSLNGYGIVNNEYLEILAETGAVGLMVFLGFLVTLAYEAWRGYNRSDSAKRQTIFYLGLGLLAVFIQYNFFSTLYIIYIWAFLALLRSQFDNPNNVILKPTPPTPPLVKGRTGGVVSGR